MSSARRIVEGAGSLWNELTPLLPTYVRRVNLGDYERVMPSFSSQTDPARHFLINDVAFSLALGQALHEPMPPDVVWENTKTIWEKRLPRLGTLASGNPLELAESQFLARRLIDLINAESLVPKEFRAVRNGIGRLEAVEIDIIGDDFAIEVKAGDRPFRSIDFRQIILSIATIGYDAIDFRVYLMNPREGIYWSGKAKDFVETVSLIPFVEFLEQLKFILSDIGVSN